MQSTEPTSGEEAEKGESEEAEIVEIVLDPDTILKVLHIISHKIIFYNIP